MRIAVNSESMKRRPARASIPGSPHREQGGGRAKYKEEYQPPTQAALSEYRSEGWRKTGRNDS